MQKDTYAELCNLKKIRPPDFSHAINEFKLSSKEVMSIVNYTDFGASKLNNILRSRNKTDKEAELNIALNRIPSYDNEIVYVDFSVSISENLILSWFKRRVGEVVQFPNFLSTSKKTMD